MRLSNHYVPCLFPRPLQAAELEGNPDSAAGQRMAVLTEASPFFDKLG